MTAGRGPALMAAAALLAVTPAACGEPAPDCAALVKAQRWQAAVPVCEVEAHARPGGSAGLRLATALLYSGAVAEAGRVAERVVAGGDPAAVADAAYIAGAAALRRGDEVGARGFLARAKDGHAGAPARLARDVQQLAGLHAACGEYRTALQLIGEGEAGMVAAPDVTMLAYFAIARAELYRRLGDDAGAQEAIGRAAVLVALGRAATLDRAGDGLDWIELKLGVVDLDARRFALAEERLQGLRRRTRSPAIREAADFNLAWLASRAGRVADAKAILGQIRVEGAGDDTRVALDYGWSVVAQAEGRLDDADALLAQAEGRALADEWRWDVPLQRAYVAQRRGDHAGAEAALRRAVAAVDTLATRDVRFLAGGGLRRPYDELFGLLAAQGRWDEALAQLVVLDRIRLSAAVGDGETSWGANRGPAPGPCGVPAAARAAGDPVADVDPARVVAALRAAARDHELVVVGLGGGKLWRIELRDGAVSGRAVAELAEARALIERVVADPDDVEATTAMGALLLPASRRADPLYVVANGELARVPLPALRVEGGRVIERRPVVRVAPLAFVGASANRQAGADAAIATTGPLVLGDPSAGDRAQALPGAAAEARWVAGHLGARLVLGAEATAAALLDARPALLHVATHADLVDREAVLQLADGPVGAAQIDRRDWRATRLVVLAACGSAAAVDPQGRDSLATAFLRRGAGTVLATLWSIDDARAEAFVRDFYQAGGAADPVGALARVQRRWMATRPAREWAAFVAMAAAPTAPRPAPR